MGIVKTLNKNLKIRFFYAENFLRVIHSEKEKKENMFFEVGFCDYGESVGCKPHYDKRA